MAKKGRDGNIVVVVPVVIAKLGAEETTRIAADALAASDYKYDVYITKTDDKALPIRATLVPPDGVDAKRAKQLDDEAKAIAAGVRTVRDLGNGPGNLVTPTFLGQRAEEVAKNAGIKCTVYGRREIEKMKMGGLLAVNRGSIEEPRFIVLEYAPRKATKHVALVGKGITFDSGGISIKPSEKMEEMKFDMCVAAAVIGTIQAAAMLALPVRVTGIIASTDNLPSGSAYKPGDIITTMNGKTVEVVNTDAEGWMILSDALHYASELKPDHILDYATLTGACVVALGHQAAGLFTPDDGLAAELDGAAAGSGERLWRLPLLPEFLDEMKSLHADLRNSAGRWGAASTAAAFLSQFVGGLRRWAHLDIAGMAYARSEDGRGTAATGFGVALLVDWLRGQAG